MLTRSFVAPSAPTDEATHWAVAHEWLLREQAYRAAFPEELATVKQVSIAEMVPARDAGDICAICGQVTTWTDHLPPLEADGVVRCFVGVSYIHPANVVIDDTFPRV